MIYVVVSFGLIILIDLVPLIKNKKWLEVVAFGTILILTLIYAVGFVLDLPVPSFAIKIWELFKKIGIYYKSS